MMADGTQDRGAMIVNLEEAAAPAYFVFDAAALADEDSALKSAASVAEQIVPRPRRTHVRRLCPSKRRRTTRRSAPLHRSLRADPGIHGCATPGRRCRGYDQAVCAQGRSTYAVSPSYTAGSSRLDIHHLDHGEIGRGNGRHGTSPAGRSRHPRTGGHLHT